MVSQVVLGHHPLTGHFGAFVALPGYDANTSPPQDPSRWALTTAAGRIASVIQTGLCVLDQDVYFPGGLNFAPYVICDPISGNALNPAESTEIFDSSGKLKFGGTRFKIAQNGSVSFRMVKNVSWDFGGTGLFRFVVFNLSAN